MSSSVRVVFLTTAVAVMALAVGCSSKKSTTPTTGTTHPIQMVAIDSVIRLVAPPEFSAPVTSPASMDSMWLYGNHPMMDIVFGSHEPQALYSNVNDFKLSRDIMQSTLVVDENNHVVPGVYVDSFPVDMGDGLVMQHFTATVTEQNGPITIPAGLQEVMGSSISVDYVLSVDVVEMPNAQVKIGMSLNDSVQTIFQWDAGTGNPADQESRLRYGRLNLADSVFEFKGVGYVLHENGDNFNYAFNISSSANSDFAYRMSYFSNGMQGHTALYSVNGGGNKSTEFALMFRQYVPADTTDCDSMWIRTQLFGPDYSEGNGLITSYENYLGEELVFLNSLLPSAMITDPWLNH
jgi:hypothetical protein